MILEFLLHLLLRGKGELDSARDHLRWSLLQAPLMILYQLQDFQVLPHEPRSQLEGKALGTFSDFHTDYVKIPSHLSQGMDQDQLPQCLRIPKATPCS